MVMSPDIFYVEDDQDFAVKEVNEGLTVNIVGDGNSAIAALQQYAQERQRPKIILLDLNLPGLSGLDILKRIKEIPFLKYVPVILFSTSDDLNDVRTSLEIGANAFLTKPNGYHNLITCVQSMYDFWFSQNRSIN
jgi:CheY-like chemotaxis protein